jgi:hypothetical protein
MTWAGHVGEKGDRYRISVAKPEGKGTLGISKRRWKIVLKWILQKYDGDGMDWIDLAQDRDQ